MNYVFFLIAADLYMLLKISQCCNSGVGEQLVKFERCTIFWNIPWTFIFYVHWTLFLVIQWALHHHRRHHNHHRHYLDFFICFVSLFLFYFIFIDSIRFASWKWLVWFCLNIFIFWKLLWPRKGPMVVKKVRPVQSK